MDETNESGVENEVEETLDLPEIEEGQEDTTDWKGEAQKLREKAIAQRERTKGLKQQLKDAKEKLAKIEPPAQTQRPSASEGLDDNALDYLDVKGVSESEDIKVVESIVKKTGMSVREALKDEYVQAKLTANKAAREVKAATPSGTHRTGSGQTNDLATAIAKYKASDFDPKTLPEDFSLRSKVINTIEQENKSNKPSWH